MVINIFIFYIPSFLYLTVQLFGLEETPIESRLSGRSIDIARVCAYCAIVRKIASDLILNIHSPCCRRPNSDYLPKASLATVQT
jgi:hypothetical protein